MEVARGQVADRPWGATLAALHRRRHTGRLTLTTESGACFTLDLAAGKLVGATSPIAADAALRIALAVELAPVAANPAISDRLEAAPERDEVDVIAEVAGLTAAQVAALRDAIAIRRGARTFAVEAGEFAIVDDPPQASPCAIDLRAVIYRGALTRLPDRRIATELAAFGARFALREAVDPEPWGIPDDPELFAAMRGGASLAELEARGIHLGVRTVHAIAYALLSYGACVATEAPAVVTEPSRGRANTLRVPVRAPTVPPMPRVSTRPIVMRASSERIATGTAPPRTITSPRTPTPSKINDATIAAAAYQAALRALTANELDQAIAQLTRAVALVPHQLEYPATLAWAKFCAAPDKLAIATETRLQLSALAAHEPRVARFYLGRMERMLGRDREALIHFRDVLSTQPGHAEAAAEVRAIEHAAPKR